MKMEHSESPRYALLDPDRGEVALFTDPRDRTRTVRKADFFHRVSWSVTNGRLGRMPAYIVAMSDDVLNQLERTKYLHSVLWHLEAAASRCCVPVELVSVEIEGTKVDNDDLAQGLVAMVRLDFPVHSDDGTPPMRIRLPHYGVLQQRGESASVALQTAMSEIRSLAISQHLFRSFIAEFSKST